MAINFPSTAGQATDGSFTYNVAGIIYAWNGSSWQAAGAGASATDRTLFSVTQNAAGSAALSYNNTNGVFSYTPPDLSSYLTAEADTLATVTSRGSSTTDNVSVGGLTATSATVTNLNGAGAIVFSSSSGQLQQTNTLSWTTNTLNTDNIYAQGNALINGSLTAGGLTYPTTNGTSGQVLTSDGAGNVTWSAPGGLQSRATAQVTQLIANNAAANVSITTPKTYALLSIQTNVAAWVTLYMDTTSRTNDASRGETTDPVPGSGVLAEAITTGSTTQYITPGAVCFNSAGAGITYAKIVNKSGGTTNVTVTLNYVQLEA